ncbi:MAG TPA: methyltransferase type 11 [Rhodobacteraceae bacterium]|jgi:SAM-dependent methyltransferase|nr:methyltransferase type 11 [Paracoccaceae bacterium]
MEHKDVQEYYGETLQTSDDLQTNACCTAGDIPDSLKSVLAKIHPEVLSKYYGCGLIAPDALKGMRILDLGSGSGRDVYALAGLVGENGHVVGVDMTDAQLDVARSYQDYHAKAFGYAKPNTEFHKGLIEHLDELPLQAGSFDIIVSNCVLNLALDKGAVLRGAHRLLKPGGEMYFSDVYADRRMPEALAKDKVLYGECLSGALYWNDFENLAKACGFDDPRLVEDRVLTIENPEIEAKVGNIGFSSATYRLFKLDGLEPAGENYGQTVIYKGSIEEAKNSFRLDKYQEFETGKTCAVCGNTYAMLQGSRFAAHFEFSGTRDTHLGLFGNNGETCPFDGAQNSGDVATGGCC